MTVLPEQPAGQAPTDAAAPPAETSLDDLRGLNSADFNAQVMEQHNAVKQEAATIPYVADREDLASLKAEYQNGSEVFRRKIDRIEQRYSHMRRTRGDGNCFFRAFIFAYLEHLLHTQNTQECTRFSSLIQEWRAKLIDAGFQELVFEDILPLLLQHIDGISQGLLGQEALEGAYRDDMVSNLVVMLMRLITSAEIRRREDFFLPFILGMYDDPPSSVEMFCQRFVEPMAEESDNIHIVALTDALQVPVRVVHLDQSGAGGMGGGMGAGGGDMDVNTHDFIPDSCQGRQPVVHVLYRPGHYDILYARNADTA